MRADDPTLLTPDQRLRELAALLAAGLVRLAEPPLHPTPALVEKPLENRPESP